MNAIIISSFPQDWNVDPSSLLRWISDTASSFMAFVSQPHVYIVIAAFVLTFTAFYTFILALGFGPVGIGAGTLAAAFQSWAYGGLTPAGGIFALLTSMAMLGILMPIAAIPAAFFASIVAFLFWELGAGR